MSEDLPVKSSTSPSAPGGRFVVAPRCCENGMKKLACASGRRASPPPVYVIVTPTLPLGPARDAMAFASSGEGFPDDMATTLTSSSGSVTKSVLVLLLDVFVPLAARLPPPAPPPLLPPSSCITVAWVSPAAAVMIACLTTASSIRMPVAALSKSGSGGFCPALTTPVGMQWPRGRRVNAAAGIPT